MMRRIVSTLLLAAAGSALALGAAAPLPAQPLPFDMSKDVKPPAARAVPLGLSPGGMPGAPTPAAEETTRVHILPAGETRLSGEQAERRWSFNLTAGTPEEAQLHLGYQNSVMVAPELSALKVSVNGTTLGQRPIQSAAGIAETTFAIPAGVLAEGENSVVIEATQRHRTDCTVDSTYELWTDLDPYRTYVSYAGDEGARFTSLRDVSEIGMDAKGRTRVAVVAPGLDDPQVAETLLSLAQRVALLTNAPQLNFTLARSLEEAAPDAALTLVIGTQDDLAALDLDAPAETGVLSPDQAPGRMGPVLVISGPTTGALKDALEVWSSAAGTPAEYLETWPGTSAPLLASGQSLQFTELGIPTERFSGRRYSREFSMAVPADFYAQSYAEATIMLDAAFSKEVRPGSRIDIYVNDRIATTVPIMDAGGGVLRQLPIRVSLREVRPGPNRVRLEAVMLTEADEVCVPGTTASDTPRFAIFDTSRFVMPEYARIAQRPDLAAFAAEGLAFGEDNGTLPVVMDLRTEETLAAAMNILGRMAASGGEIRPVSLQKTGPAVAESSALIIAPASHLPSSILEHARIAPATESGWTEDKTVRLALGRDGESELDEWRDSLETSPIRRRAREIADTLQNNFDLSLTALRLLPGEAEIFTPDRNDTILLAQTVNPAGTGTWTLVTAPTPVALQEGSAELAGRSVWNQIGGRLSVYAAAAQSVTNMAPVKVDLLPTQPWSLSNTRLIITNWMSANALAYSLLLALACVMLGAVTLALLSQIGRRS